VTMRACDGRTGPPTPAVIDDDDYAIVFRNEFRETASIHSYCFKPDLAMQAHARAPSLTARRALARPARRSGNLVVAAMLPESSSPVAAKTTPSFRVESRRVVLATAVILAATAGKALAAGGIGKSSRELAKASQARREKLKAASQAMREKGKAESAFGDSKFGLGEDATTPNRVNRTGEGGAGI
jgi:hypothetical protein